MIKKVLTSSINYDHRQTGMRHALDRIFGAENICEFDYLAEQRRHAKGGEINRMFLEQAKAFGPDWIWLQVQDTNVLTAQSILEVRRLLPKCVVTHWTGDCRRQVSPYLSSFCRATHLTFVSSVGQLPMFREAGAKEAIYCQIGLDWEEDVEGNTPWRPNFDIPDVVFCGGYYGDVFPGTKERADAVDAIRGAGIPVGIVGGGWPSGYPVIGQCGVKDQYHVWTRAKVGLNINNFNDIELYYSDRQIIAMASGTPVVCKYVPGLEKEFKNGMHCLWYKDLPQLVEQVKALLSSPAQAKAMGAAGRAEVMKNHSWEARYRKILPEIQRISGELA